MSKLNCWEFKHCGRQPGGANVDKLGPCPAVTDASFEGYNGGHHGGRICWAVAGTFCGGRVQGSFAQKRLSCMDCEFYTLVESEEGNANFRLLKRGQRYTRLGV